MEATLLHSTSDQESMSHGKKARNHQKRSSKTHRFTDPSRTYTTPGNLYLENLAKMEMMLNPPYPHPVSSSSSWPRLHQFQQPPLLPLDPMAYYSSFSSCDSNKKLYNKDQKYTTQAPIRPHKPPTYKAKKYPDSKTNLIGGVGSTKRCGPDPESEQPRNVINEMKFCESLIYAMSPSPSSLPMPKFSILKPKLVN